MWLTTGTVSTSLDHPTSGKTQLFRKNGPDYQLLERIFENPRVHSGSGYREKKKKEQVRVIYLQYFHIFSIKFRRRFVKDFPQSLTSKIKYKCNRCGKTLIYFWKCMSIFTSWISLEQRRRSRTTNRGANRRVRHNDDLKVRDRSNPSHQPVLLKYLLWFYLMALSRYWKYIWHSKLHQNYCFSRVFVFFSFIKPPDSRGEEAWKTRADCNCNDNWCEVQGEGLPVQELLKFIPCFLVFPRLFSLQRGVSEYRLPPHFDTQVSNGWLKISDKSRTFYFCHNAGK